DIRHLRVDILIGGVRIAFEEGNRRHDLTRLAIATLWHIEFEPGLLDRMRPVLRNPLDRHDLLFFGDISERDRARTRGHTVDMHGTSPASRYAAAEFRAGQTNLFANYPQQRGLGLSVDLVHGAIYVQPRQRIILRHRLD